MTGTDAALDAAMATLQSMVDADGFELSATAVDDGSVDLVVAARDGACADCLVPKNIMRSIADAELAPAGRRVRELHYPADAAH
jgi:hypothetical protein